MSLKSKPLFLKKSFFKNVGNARWSMEDRQDFSENERFLQLKITSAIEFLESYLAESKKKLKGANSKIILDLLYELKTIRADFEKGELAHRISLIIKKIDDCLADKTFKKIHVVMDGIKDALNEIKEIQHSEFLPPLEVLTKKHISWVPINRICFRGDDRDPSVMFVTGFKPLEETDENAILIERAFNSANEKVIAFSSRFKSATIFPVNLEKDNTWVYIFKANRGFDVHQHGYKVFAQIGLDEKTVGGLFADELVTDEIKPGDIIGAVRVIRMPIETWNEPRYFKKPPAHLSKDISSLSIQEQEEIKSEKEFLNILREHGEFVIGEYRENPKCELSNQERKIVREFVDQERNFNKRSKIASKEEIAQYLLENQRLLEELGVKKKYLSDYLKGKEIPKPIRLIIVKFVNEFKESIKHSSQVPMPDTGYHSNLFSKSSKKNDEDDPKKGPEKSPKTKQKQ